MSLRKHFATLLFLPVLASPLAALAAPAYKVAFAPAGFSASQMNNAGQVVGTSGDVPAIWYGNRVARITALPAGSFGFGINNRGQIVGMAPLPSNPVFFAPFVYSRAGVRYIALDAPWQEFGQALAINDAGQVAGMGHAPVGESSRGFLHSRGTTRLIDTFGGESGTALGINSAGHVVGIAAFVDQTLGFGHSHGFLYRDGMLRDIGTLGGRNSSAYDINSAGQIVGAADTVLVADETESSPSHAFLYYRGTMRDLGTLGGRYSTAYAINTGGIVVGATNLAEDATTVAFMYARGRMTDLNSQVRLPTGWTLVGAHDINDSGQILARACKLNDCSYWARLTPRRTSHHGAHEDGKLAVDPDGTTRD